MIIWKSIIRWHSGRFSKDPKIQWTRQITYQTTLFSGAVVSVFLRPNYAPMKYLMSCPAYGIKNVPLLMTREDSPEAIQAKATDLLILQLSLDPTSASDLAAAA